MFARDVGVEDRNRAVWQLEAKVAPRQPQPDDSIAFRQRQRTDTA